MVDSTCWTGLISVGRYFDGCILNVYFAAINIDPEMICLMVGISFICPLKNT